MIRSPISSEERLKNRVEALEDRVKELTDDFAKMFVFLCGTANGLVETAKRVDEHDEDIEVLTNNLWTS